MYIEQPTIEIGNLSEQAIEFWYMGALAQSFVKKFQQEVAVEGMELVFAPFLLHTLQSVGEIVGVTIQPAWYLCVQEALALDEIDEHQAVEHERGVPLAISLRVNPPDEVQERSVLQ